MHSHRGDGAQRAIQRQRRRRRLPSLLLRAGRRDGLGGSGEHKDSLGWQLRYGLLPQEVGLREEEQARGGREHVLRAKHGAYAVRQARLEGRRRRRVWRRRLQDANLCED